MKIQEFLMSLKSVQKYADRYPAPLIKYEHVVPDRHLDSWIETNPSAEEVAVYYLGVLGRKPHDIPMLLASLEKYKNWSVPVVEGILTREYWESWAQDNLIMLMDEKDKFLRGEA